MSLLGKAIQWQEILGHIRVANILDGAIKSLLQKVPDSDVVSKDHLVSVLNELYHGSARKIYHNDSDGSIHAFFVQLAEYWRNEVAIEIEATDDNIDVRFSVPPQKTKDEPKLLMMMVCNGRYFFGTADDKLFAEAILGVPESGNPLNVLFNLASIGSLASTPG